LQPNPFGKSILNNGFKILQQIFRLNFDSLAFLAASKQEHLPHDVRAPLDAGLDGFQNTLSLWVSGRQPEKFDGHHDRGENVVQVVRDAPG
jgi:hypothetical protein